MVITVSPDTYTHVIGAVNDLKIAINKTVFKWQLKYKMSDYCN